MRFYAACHAITRADGRGWQKTFRSALGESDLIELWEAGSPDGILYVSAGVPVNSPVHRRLHRWWLRAQAPDAIESMRAPITHQAIDELAGRETADLDAELAQKIPMRVIAAVLGLPVDDGFLGECRQLMLASLATRPWPAGPPEQVSTGLYWAWRPLWALFHVTPAAPDSAEAGVSNAPPLPPR